MNESCFCWFSKTGRPPSKKLKDRKATARVGLVQNNVSSDFTGIF